MQLTPAVAARDVSITLGGRPVVRRVDLSVAPGEFVTILGSNGSGKSTLVRGCVGLLPLVGGRIELFGVPVDAFSQWRRVGYVPQKATIASGVPATVGEVVMSGRLSRRRLVGWAGRADRAAVRRALELVDLPDRARDPVAHLSGGQQQRVMIARALVAAPDLLVMDEPNAGVDHTSQRVLADLLAQLRAEGTAILMVAHELGPLAPLVDRAVVLRDGRVQSDGPVRGLPAGVDTDGHHHHETTTDSLGFGGDGVWRS